MNCLNLVQYIWLKFSHTHNTIQELWKLMECFQHLLLIVSNTFFWLLLMDGVWRLWNIYWIRCGRGWSQFPPFLPLVYCKSNRRYSYVHLNVNLHTDPICQCMLLKLTGKLWKSDTTYPLCPSSDYVNLAFLPHCFAYLNDQVYKCFRYAIWCETMFSKRV